jgi:hypothetical protein
LARLVAELRDADEHTLDVFTACFPDGFSEFELNWARERLAWRRKAKGRAPLASDAAYAYDLLNNIDAYIPDATPA